MLIGSLYSGWPALTFHHDVLSGAYIAISRSDFYLHLEHLCLCSLLFGLFLKTIMRGFQM